MPKFHYYPGNQGCYVLTRIGESVVAYQLTPKGEEKLTAAGIVPGQRFPRVFLLDLYSRGDAYNHGSVRDHVSAATGQLDLDFADDPDRETALPCCDECGSVNNLHLTISGAVDLEAKLLCAECRADPEASSEISIPVALLARPILSRLFDIRPGARKAQNVMKFEELLHAEFESRWEALRAAAKRSSQTGLFDPDNDGLTLRP